MPAPTTSTGILKAAPYGADGVTLTPSATAFAASAWVEVEDVALAPWVVAGVVVTPADITADAELDVGIGAAGFEIPIARYICRTGSSGATTLSHTDLLSPILSDRVPVGSRVAVRMRKSGTDTTGWRVKVLYYEGPLAGSINATATEIAVRYPASAVSTQVTTPASAWGNSPYGAIIASLPFTGIIVGATIELNGSGPRFEVDLATGPTGAEVPIWTLWENSGNTSQGIAWFPLTTPLGPIPAGTQISCRARDDSAFARAVNVSILVLPVPYASTTVETTLPLRVVPTSNSLLALTAGVGVTPGSWVEVWSSSPQANVIGFVVDAGSALARDIQLGIGGSGSEVVIASQRVENNPASQRLNGLWPTAIPIPAGTRVALRTRIGAVDAGLQYFEGSSDSDNTTPALQDTMQVAPVSVSGAIRGVNVTPGDSWAWGAWVELTAGETTAIGIYGLSIDSRRDDEEYEWEIGIGAGGAETAIATLGNFVGASFASMMRGLLQLPVIRTVPANTRVAVRLRTESNGAFTGDHRATLLFYAGIDIVEPPPDTGGTPEPGTDPDPGLSLCGGQVIVPWVTIQTATGEKVYAGQEVDLDTVPKEARVRSFGTISRGLSSQEGAIETATQTLELVDHDRALRAAAEAGTLLNRRVDTYGSTKAGIIAGSIPRRLNQGLIRRYKALSNLGFRLELEDFFSALLNAVQGKRTVPQRTMGLPTFSNLPDALNGKGIPILYGLCSDEDLGPNALGVVPATYVGDTVVNSQTVGEFLVCGHAVQSILSAFIPAGGGLSTGTAEPSRTKITTDIPDVWLPGHPNWIANVGADPYIERNGERLCVVYMFGPRKELAATGQVPLALNVAGIEDVGDGTGDLIDSLPLQLQHLLTNFILQSYETGPWLSIPDAISGDYSCISSTTFDAVHTHMVDRLPPIGYQGAFMLGWDGRLHGFRDVVRDMLKSGDFYIGINKDGQIIAAVRNPSDPPVKHWTDVLDIVDGTFDADVDWPALANRINYRAQQRYVQAVATLAPATGEFLPTSLREELREWGYENWVQSNFSIANHSSSVDDGRRPYDVDFPMVRNTAVADNVAAQILNQRKAGPIMAQHTAGICGTDVDLGDNQEVTHFEGPLGNGWVERLTRVEKIAISLDDPSRAVAFLARDLDAIVVDPDVT